MAGNKGMIMQYMDAHSNIQRVEMRYADQKICAGNTEKAFVRLINDKGDPIIEQGSQVNKIVLFEKLIRIGFID